MTLRIQKDSNGNCTTLRLIGRIRSEHLLELQKEIVDGGTGVALDLEEVNLVDMEVVKFLTACEAEGVNVTRCSPYIREWMLREKVNGK
jgi:hypothetical protein